MTSKTGSELQETATLAARLNQDFQVVSFALESIGAGDLTWRLRSMDIPSMLTLPQPQALKALLLLGRSMQVLHRVLGENVKLATGTNQEGKAASAPTCRVPLTR